MSNVRKLQFSLVTLAAMAIGLSACGNQASMDSDEAVHFDVFQASDDEQALANSGLGTPNYTCTFDPGTTSCECFGTWDCQAMVDSGDCTDNDGTIARTCNVDKSHCCCKTNSKDMCKLNATEDGIGTSPVTSEIAGTATEVAPPAPSAPVSVGCSAVGSGGAWMALSGLLALYRRRRARA